MRRISGYRFYQLEDFFDTALVVGLIFLAIAGVTGYVFLCVTEIKFLFMLPIFIPFLASIAWKVYYEDKLRPTWAEKEELKENYKLQIKQLKKTIALQNKMRNVKSL